MIRIYGLAVLILVIDPYPALPNTAQIEASVHKDSVVYDACTLLQTNGDRLASSAIGRSRLRAVEVVEAAREHPEALNSILASNVPASAFVTHLSKSNSDGSHPSSVLGWQERGFNDSRGIKQTSSIVQREQEIGLGASERVNHSFSERALANAVATANIEGFGAPENLESRQAGDHVHQLLEPRLRAFLLLQLGDIFGMKVENEGLVKFWLVLSAAIVGFCLFGGLICMAWSFVWSGVSFVVDSVEDVAEAAGLVSADEEDSRKERSGICC